MSMHDHGLTVHLICAVVVVVIQFVQRMGDNMGCSPITIGTNQSTKQFNPFGEVCEQVLHDGCKLFDGTLKCT